MNKEKEGRIFRKKLKETKRIWKEENKPKLKERQRRDLFLQSQEKHLYKFVMESKMGETKK